MSIVKVKVVKREQSTATAFRDEQFSLEQKSAAEPMNI